MTILDLDRPPGDGHARRLRVGMLLGSVSEASGGVSEAVRALALALARIPQIAVDIFSLAEPERELRDFGDMPVHLARPLGPRSFGYAPDLPALLYRHPVDVLHVHGLWMYPSLAALQWSRRTGRRYLVSPHGMLDPWALANRAWKKRIARFLFEDAHLAGAWRLHALCAAERSAIEAAGVATPIVVLPNGVARPSRASSRAAWRTRLPADAKCLLFLGRVTPKKRVAELIRAWTRARRADSPWHLVIVGPADPAYGEELARLARQSKGSVHLAGPAYGGARDLAYASADAFVLPSLSEGLPMAVLEAFAAGLPALLSSQCNLPEAYDYGCALEIRPDEQGIEDGLRRLFGLGAEATAAMEMSARRLVAERFDWDVIAAKFAALYSAMAVPQSGVL